MRVVQFAVRVGCLLAVLLCWALAPAQAGAASTPLVLRPHWRLILRDRVVYVAPTGNYVAVLQYGSTTIHVTDERTGKRLALSPPNCPAASPARPGLMFGGPWLMVQCSANNAQSPYELYNLVSGGWVSFSVSSQCQGICRRVAIGRYWVKLLTDEGISAYGPMDYYLQNISTGKFERDPATPGGTVFDNLGVPSGSSPLCGGLRYPTVYDRHYEPPKPYLGSVSFSGGWALMYGAYSYRVRRCGSDLRLVLPQTTGYPGPFNQDQPLMNSRLVIVTPDTKTLEGWFLPSLQHFTIHLPAAISNNNVMLVGLTKRTIYLEAGYTGREWTATLPSPPRHSR